MRRIDLVELGDYTFDEDTGEAISYIDDVVNTFWEVKPESYCDPDFKSWRSKAHATQIVKDYMIITEDRRNKGIPDAHAVKLGGITDSEGLAMSGTFVYVGRPTLQSWPNSRTYAVKYYSVGNAMIFYDFYLLNPSVKFDPAWETNPDFNYYPIFEPCEDKNRQGEPSYEFSIPDWFTQPYPETEIDILDDYLGDFPGLPRFSGNSGTKCKFCNGVWCGRY